MAFDDVDSRRGMLQTAVEHRAERYAQQPTRTTLDLLDQAWAAYDAYMASADRRERLAAHKREMARLDSLGDDELPF